MWMNEEVMKYVMFDPSLGLSQVTFTMGSSFTIGYNREESWLLETPLFYPFIVNKYKLAITNGLHYVCFGDAPL